MKKSLLILSLILALSACERFESTTLHSDWRRVTGGDTCNCSLEVPPSWSEDIGVYEKAEIEVAGSNLQVAVFLSPKSNTVSQFNLDQHAEEVLKNLENISTSYTEHTRRRMKIDGKNALQFRVERTDENNVESINLLTFIEGTNTYYEILGWSFPDAYAQTKDLMSEVVRSFKVGSL